MPADRLVPTSSSPPPVSGAAYLDDVAEEIAALWNGVVQPLTGVGGTANALTASLAPPLAGTPPAGMAFSVTPAAANTGAATIAINGAAALPIVTDDGSALAAGMLAAGRTALLVAGAGGLRLIGSSALQKINNVQVFTAPGTWTKPAGTPADALVIFKAWGGGGGGGTNHSNFSGGGGGGGAYEELTVRAGDLPASLTVNPAAAVGVATAGNDSTVSQASPAKTWLRARGGGRGGNGNNSSGGGGGQGGGSVVNGGNGANGVNVGAGNPVNSSPGGNTDGGGGRGGSTAAANGGSGSSNPAGPAPTAWAGAGGGASAQAGGAASLGGAGGGAGSGAAGVSLNGGSGGAPSVAGAPRGGGGGSNAGGGRGEVIIQTIG